MARTKAERKAEAVLRELEVSSPPVDPRELAQRLGITVRDVELTEDCSATLIRTAGSAVIGVNRQHSPTRQRFSIAHELGHFVLHKGHRYIDKRTSVQFRNHESGTGTKWEEIEANRFAAALLMPPAWVRAEFKKRTFDLGATGTLQELADIFQVSAEAMSYRLMNLGLLDPEAHA